MGTNLTRASSNFASAVTGGDPSECLAALAALTRETGNALMDMADSFDEDRSALIAIAKTLKSANERMMKTASAYDGVASPMDTRSSGPRAIKRGTLPY